MGIWYLTATTSGELERRLQDHQPGLLKGRLVQTTHLKCRNRIEMAPGHFTYSPEPALEIVIGGEVGACNPAAAGRPKVPRSKTGAPVSGGQSLPRAASARERGALLPRPPCRPREAWRRSRRRWSRARRSRRRLLLGRQARSPRHGPGWP